jgi:hypothetical protein
MGSHNPPNTNEPPHFTKEETEAQNVKVTSQSHMVSSYGSRDPNPGLSSELAPSLAPDTAYWEALFLRAYLGLKSNHSASLGAPLYFSCSFALHPQGQAAVHTRLHDH